MIPRSGEKNKGKIVTILNRQQHPQGWSLGVLRQSRRYFLRVAMPPRMWRWALLSSRTSRAWR